MSYTGETGPHDIFEEIDVKELPDDSLRLKTKNCPCGDCVAKREVENHFEKAMSPLKQESDILKAALKIRGEDM